jgi:hypothetical protein
LRREALRYRWYLEVQRESVGLRHHHCLDEFYRIPPADPSSIRYATSPVTSGHSTDCSRPSDASRGRPATNMEEVEVLPTACTR